MKLSYSTKLKMKCKRKYCGFEGIPTLKMIVFKNSKHFSCTAECRKCGSYIDNISMKDVQVKDKR